MCTQGDVLHEVICSGEKKTARLFWHWIRLHNDLFIYFEFIWKSMNRNWVMLLLLFNALAYQSQSKKHEGVNEFHLKARMGCCKTTVFILLKLDIRGIEKWPIVVRSSDLQSDVLPPPPPPPPPESVSLAIWLHLCLFSNSSRWRGTENLSIIEEIWCQHIENSTYITNIQPKEPPGETFTT